MKLKKYGALAAISLATITSSQAVTVFSDTFNYTVANAFIAEGGWTALVPGGTLGDNFGSDAGSGLMWGNPTSGGNTAAGLEYNYTSVLGAGDVITMDATVLRDFGGYFYNMTAILWDGADAGTRFEAATSNQEGSSATAQALTQLSYTITPADITAGRNHVIFQYSHSGNWGETGDVTFGVVQVPEPSSTALLGLGGLALILRRRK